jgi:CHAT domain-containing protein/tetratricopeptide (TPR) repeat protein
MIVGIVLSALSLQGCLAGSILTSNVVAPLMGVPKDELLFDYGKYEEFIAYMNGPQSLFSQKNRILNENIQKIKKNESTTLQFIFYQKSYSRLSLAYMELGQLERAEAVCDAGLRETATIQELFKRYRYKHDSPQEDIASTRTRLFQLKGYLIWFRTADLKRASQYFDTSFSGNLPDNQTIGFLNVSQRFHLYHLMESAAFNEKIVGDYRKSLSQYKKSLEIIDKMGITSIDEKYAHSMMAYRKMMVLYMKLGELEEARKTLGKYNELTGRTIFKTGKFFVGSSKGFLGYLSMADSAAGALFALQKDFDESKKYFDMSYKAVSKIGPEDTPSDQRAVGVYYVLYGAYYLGMQNKYDKEAAENVDKGIPYLKPSYYESINEDLDIETAYRYSAELHSLLKNTEKAIQQSNTAIRLAGRYYNSITAASAYTLLGSIYFDKGDNQKAKQSYEAALNLNTGVESTENWKLYYGLGQVYERLNNQGEALKNYELAVNEVEKLWQGRFKDTQKQVSFIDDRLVVFEPVIRILARQKKAEEAVDYIERSKSRAFFETSLYDTGGNAGKLDPKPLTAPQIKKSIPIGTAFIEYYVGKDSVIGAVIGPNQVYIKELSVNAKALGKSVLLFRDTIENGLDGYQEQGAQLYDVLIRPFENQLSNSDSLCIIPHGVLHYLPFQALVVSDNSRKGIPSELIQQEQTLLVMLGNSSRGNQRGIGVRKADKKGSDRVTAGTKTRKELKSELESIRSQIVGERIKRGFKETKPTFLIENYKIFYAPSSTILNAVHKTGSTKKNRLIAFGNPPAADVRDLGLKDEDTGEAVTVLEKLPNSEIEVQSVGKLFTEKLVVTGEVATETAAKTSSSNGDLLLFSTHGILMRKDPLNSCIFLNKDSKNNGRLTVSDIEKLNLNANLVVLSACETGLISGYEGVGENIYDAKFPQGDDMVGLQRAFLKTGSASVLSTLWSVADDSTSTLIIDFFKRYLDGKDKPSALQEAEVMLMQTRTEWQHPYYWAPFVLSGDWR